MDECLHRHSAERMVRQGRGWETCDDTHRNQTLFHAAALKFYASFLPNSPAVSFDGPLDSVIHQFVELAIAIEGLFSRFS